MPNRIAKQDIDEICEAFVRGLQLFGESAFDESQRNVPVDKGTLKQSGSFRPTSKGLDIEYTAGYALVRENVVPHRTAQKPPRGTHYMLRALQKEAQNINFYVAKAIQMCKLGRRGGRVTGTRHGKTDK